jgi:oligoendopeptidase F
MTLLSYPILCQNNFAAIPADVAGQYHFDFPKNFFASPEAEKAERANYYAALKQLESLKGKVVASPDNLLRAESLYDKVLIEFVRHYNYLFLRYAINTEDETSDADASTMDAEFTKRTAFLQQELIQINKTTLDTYIKRRPALEVYRFAIESAARNEAHTLSLKEEETLGITFPLTSEWQYDLYQKLSGRAVLEKIKTPDGGQLDLRRDRLAIANHPDRAVREQGFKTFYAGFASQRDLYAFALINLVQAKNLLAELHHFDDAPDEIYFKNFLTKAQVNNLLQEIEKQSDVYKNAQRLRAHYAAKRLGYANVNLWDVSANTNANELPRFDIQQASRTIREVLSPLGAEFGSELSALLDPANGRMDIVPDQKRRYAGGFSKGFPGVTTVFFSGNFAGYYNDTRVLGHESTHAVHRQLMKINRVLPAYAEGPHYLSESFALFSDLLLPDYLYKQSTEPARRRFFLERFLERVEVVFTIAQEETLEQAIYEEVKAGKIKNADDLDALTKQIASRFSIWTDKHDELKMQWITSALFYEDPLYDINYAYGSLLALKYYELYSRNPQEFIQRYIALLKNGFNAPPDVLLKRFLDVDLGDPRLVTDAVRLYEKKINLLEAEYSK